MILEVYFDYSSPFAYLGFTQAERVAEETGATIRWRPFLLGGLFRAIGTPNVPLLEMTPAKQRYQLLDMRRWAHHWGIRFGFPSRFPMNTVTALRMTLQLPDEAVPGFARAVFEAYWADDRDIADPGELATIAEACGLRGEELLAGASQQPVKDRLRQATDEAAQRGVCGAPSFIVRRDDDDDGMVFWGQDRLELVGEALRGWRPACG